MSHCRACAVSGLIVLIAYVGLQYWAHERAIALGSEAAEQNRWRDARVQAIPQPLSPFHWKIIIEHKQHYHTALVKLFGEPRQAGPEAGFFSQLAAAYQSPKSLAWSRGDRYGYDRYAAVEIRRAWSSEANTDFRRFSRFPVLASAPDSAGNCYWFSDLRFEIPGRQASPLFTYGLCARPETGSYTLKRPDEPR